MAIKTQRLLLGLIERIIYPLGDGWGNHQRPHVVVDNQYMVAQIVIPVPNFLLDLRQDDWDAFGPLLNVLVPRLNKLKQSVNQTRYFDMGYRWNDEPAAEIVIDIPFIGASEFKSRGNILFCKVVREEIH